MAKTQESIADIVAAMRILGKLDEESTDKISRSLVGFCLRTYADRIEAAWKRESKAIATEHAVLPAVCITKGGDAAARRRIATPAEGMPPKRDAHRGAHPETAESCLGTGEMENRQTVQIGEVSGGGRAEAKPRTATAGADPEPAKSLGDALPRRSRKEKPMSRSNYDKPFYVDVGTSIVAIRCASNRDVVFRRDHADHPYVIKIAEEACDRMNQEAEIGRPLRNCDVGTAEEQAKRFFAFCDSNKCPSCPCIDTPKTDCALIWAQMPYEASESEAK